jgi:hypothetical protein
VKGVRSRRRGDVVPVPDSRSVTLEVRPSVDEGRFAKSGAGPRI